MRPKVQNGVSFKNLLQEGVVCGKAMVGGGGSAEQKPHGVALVAKGWLHANEDVAELLAVHQQVIAVGI